MSSVSKSRVESRVLGRGSFGVLLTPPLPPVPKTSRWSLCARDVTKQTSQRHDKHVGKVFTDAHAALEEMRASASWKALDPQGRFGLYPHACEPVDAANAANAAFGSEEDRRRLSGATMQLVIERGTPMVSLLVHSTQHTLKKPQRSSSSSSMAARLVGRVLGGARRVDSPLQVSVQPYPCALVVHHIRAMSNLFHAFQRYSSEHLVHGDVKVENICMSSTPAAPVYKLVDFGRSVHVCFASARAVDEAFAGFVYLRPTQHPPLASALAHVPHFDAVVQELLLDTTTNTTTNTQQHPPGLDETAGNDLQNALDRGGRVQESRLYNLGRYRVPGWRGALPVHTARTQLSRVMGRWGGCGSVKGALLLAGDMYALGIVLHTVWACLGAGSASSSQQAAVDQFIERLVTFDFAAGEDVGAAYDASVLDPIQGTV